MYTDIPSLSILTHVFPVALALAPLGTSQYYINLHQPSSFTLDSLSCVSLTHSAFHLHNLFKTASCLKECLATMCLSVCMCAKRQLSLNLNELNATVALTTALLFRVWLGHTLSTLVYIRWIYAMNTNPIFAISKFQTQSNISLSLSLSCSLPPTLPTSLTLYFYCVYQSA